MQPSTEKPQNTESPKPTPPTQRVRSVLGMIWGNKGALIGAIIVSMLAVTAVLVFVTESIGVKILPYNPLQQNVGPSLAPPSFAHPFGTDDLGRDVFSRVLAATPNDLAVSLGVISFALVVGSLLGSYAASRGGLIDEALMRLTDIFFALPALVLAMVIGVILGPGVTNMMIALMIVWWPPYARLARGEALKIAHQNYIEAARLSGLGRFRILIRHVLPNIEVILLVYATLDIGTVILMYSGMAYLGLAVRPPTPDWGAMVSTYKDYILAAPWLPLFPGAIIALGVVGFSMLGDGIRDSLQVY